MINDIPTTKQKATKITDIIRVIHRKGNPFAFEIIHVQRGRFAPTLGCIHELEFPRTRRHEIRRAILIAKRVATDHDRLDPTRDRSRNAFEDDWLSEDGTSEDVADLHSANMTTSHVKDKKGISKVYERGWKWCVRYHSANATSALV
jgi:hypothetical protein